MIITESEIIQELEYRMCRRDVTDEDYEFYSALRNLINSYKIKATEINYVEDQLSLAKQEIAKRFDYIDRARQETIKDYTALLLRKLDRRDTLNRSDIEDIHREVRLEHGV